MFRGGAYSRCQVQVHGTLSPLELRDGPESVGALVVSSAKEWLTQVDPVSVLLCFEKRLFFRIDTLSFGPDRSWKLKIPTL